MATQSETLQVTGIRCERCVARLAGALQGHEGLEFANATLMGQVTLSWDDERTSRADVTSRAAIVVACGPTVAGVGPGQASNRR